MPQTKVVKLQVHLILLLPENISHNDHLKCWNEIEGANFFYTIKNVRLKVHGSAREPKNQTRHNIWKSKEVPGVGQNFYINISPNSKTLIHFSFIHSMTRPIESSNSNIMSTPAFKVSAPCTTRAQCCLSDSFSSLVCLVFLTVVVAFLEHEFFLLQAKTVNNTQLFHLSRPF